VRHIYFSSPWYHPHLTCTSIRAYTQRTCEKKNAQLTPPLPDTPDAGVTPPADTGEEIAWGDATRVAAMAIDAEEFIFFWLPLGIISLKDECDELDVDDGAADRYDDAALTGYEEEEEESTDEWLEPKDTPDVTCMYVCPTSGHLLMPFFCQMRRGLPRIVPIRFGQREN